jgi:hypothetical protein
LQRSRKKNLTLVAFYGPKPDPLIHLVDRLQAVLRSELGPVFFAYEIEQVHATMIGLEGWRVSGEALGTNTTQVSGGASNTDLRGLLKSMQEMPPFHVRLGGFGAAGIYPFESRGLHPYLRSFTINGSLAVLMGWPVAGKSYPMTLDAMRRECKRYNILHKYHQKEADIDNDFFLVLGRVARGSILDEKMVYVQNTLRQLLAEREPLDLLVRPEDLTIVAYTDTQLPISSSVRYTLAEAQARVNELNLLQ